MAHRAEQPIREYTDPLVSPSCGAEIRIIAFIIDHGVIGSILRHLAEKLEHQGCGSPECADPEAASRLVPVAGSLQVCSDPHPGALAR